MEQGNEHIIYFRASISVDRVIIWRLDDGLHVAQRPDLGGLRETADVVGLGAGEDVRLLDVEARGAVRVLGDAERRRPPPRSPALLVLPQSHAQLPPRLPDVVAAAGAVDAVDDIGLLVLRQLVLVPRTEDVADGGDGLGDKGDPDPPPESPEVV